MFEGKTLVGLGCSHTQGQFEDDINISSPTCLERSWVKKLEQLGKFKDSVNLGVPGGSNYRSERVLFNFLKERSNDLVVIFTVTELSRFESINIIDLVKEEFYDVENDIAYQTEAIYRVHHPDGLDPKKLQYLEYYYSAQSSDSSDNDIINRKVTMIHCLLKSLNIEHYFLEMLCLPGTIQQEQISFSIPMITFKNEDNCQINARDWVHKYYPQHMGSCGHWNGQGQQTLAEYMFNYIKDNRYE